ncbi:DUF262 domain-containing protein [Agromyces binzhouensis]|uniref:DUF262 domain-containing protein n=1 Tax=Agromyces binzhouensis TaxID=1817495 RepID=UPI0036332067
MPELNSQTINVGRLFSQDFYFHIPDYQRPFSWDVDNLTDLIDDLTAAPRDADYFLGTLVLHEVGEATYDVVDGQQRLTALCILIACIRDTGKIVDVVELQDMLVQPARPLAGIQAKPRLHVKATTAFNDVVGTDGGTADQLGLESLTGNEGSRYRNAVQIFHAGLAAMTDQQVQDLASFIIQRCVVIFLAAKSFDDAFRLFTVVNDRGKQLRRIDILKAQNVSPDVISDPTLRAAYAKKWEGLEDEIGEAHFEDIFHSLRLIYVQDKPQGDLLKEFEARIFGKPGRPTRGSNFIDTLGQYVELYDHLFVSRDYLDETPEASRFTTLLNAMTSEFRASEWRACLLQYARKFGKAGIYEFALKIEKVYLEHWVSGMRKDERYETYTDILKGIEVAKTGTMATKLISADLEAIREGCRVKNFYTAGYAKYLLVRAEMLASELNEPRSFAVKSIEHVLPQNPGADSQWLNDFSAEDIADVVHQAGNLVLLSKSKNSSAQNRDFSDKKQTYLIPRVSDFPRSLQTLQVDEWTRELIEARTAEFAAGILEDL